MTQFTPIWTLVVPLGIPLPSTKSRVNLKHDLEYNSHTCQHRVHMILQQIPAVKV